MSIHSGCTIMLYSVHMQVQQRHSDAGEKEEMTPNVAYTSFVMNPHRGKEEDAYKEYI